MKLFTRRPQPPSELVALLGPEDRVVSWAPVTGGGTVLASRFGLWWPDENGPRMIGWERIDKAVWDSGALIVIEADVIDDVLLVDRAPISVTLDEPRDLPPTIRSRVEASVVRSELAPVPGGSARFVARKVPGQDGVTWWARLEKPTPDTPAARASVAGLIEQLRMPTTAE